VTLWALREAADPFRVPQREMMRTGPTLPYIVINATDPLLYLLPLLEQRVPIVLFFLPMSQRSNSRTAASSIDRPSSDPITTTAISAPVVRSRSLMVELSRAIVSARSFPGMSVTEVPSRLRGLGMLVSDSAPVAATKRGMSAPRAIKARDRIDRQRRVRGATSLRR
jgi:hypothetical protein